MNPHNKHFSTASLEGNAIASVENWPNATFPALAADFTKLNG
jgi:hypothetical protein